jgi:hypothetical protein
MSDHNKSSIGEGGESLQEIRVGLRELTLNSVRKTLPDRAILAACRAANLSWRERLITPVVVILHMVTAALWPENSFAASWRVIWARLASRLPGAAGQSPESGTVSKARSRVPLAVWEMVPGTVTDSLTHQAWFRGQLRMALP